MQPPVHIHEATVVVQANEEHVPYCCRRERNNNIQEHRHAYADVERDVIVAVVAVEMPVELERVADRLGTTGVFIPE